VETKIFYGKINYSFGKILGKMKHKKMARKLYGGRLTLLRIFFVAYSLFFSANLVFASATNGTIDSPYKYPPCLLIRPLSKVVAETLF